jgi:hypothetical protein
VATLPSLLRSNRAVRVNIESMRSFVKLHRLLATHEDVAHGSSRVSGNAIGGSTSCSMRSGSDDVSSAEAGGDFTVWGRPAHPQWQTALPDSIWYPEALLAKSPRTSGAIVVGESMVNAGKVPALGPPSASVDGRAAERRGT